MCIQLAHVQRQYLLQNTSVYSVEVARRVCEGESFQVQVLAEPDHGEEDSLCVYQVSVREWVVRTFHLTTSTLTAQSVSTPASI